MLINHSSQHPRANELILDDYNTADKEWLITDLNRIVPLSQITLLYVISYGSQVDKLIEILYHAHNLVSLELYDRLQLPTDPWSAEQQAKIEHLISNSKITKLYIINGHEYPLKLIQFLIDLCPRLNYLQIDTTKEIVELVKRLVLSKNINKNGHNLFWLHISNIKRPIVERLLAMINDKKKLHNDYSMDYADECDLYLWW